jgi:hypothetical protein
MVTGMPVSASLAPCAALTPTLVVEADRETDAVRFFGGIGWEGLMVGVIDAPWMLGVRAPDRSRSILVVTDDGELAVAVRDTAPRGMAVIRDARPDDAAEIAAACLPWPWMVVGACRAIDAGLGVVLRERPVLILWLGTPPPGLPRHARCFDRPSALLAAVVEACSTTVGGMRLALGGGVELDDGSLLRGAALEGLIGAYPRGFALPSRLFRSVALALAREGSAWSPQRDSDAEIRLAPSVPAVAPR